jgi:hypothetical protein
MDSGVDDVPLSALLDRVRRQIRLRHYIRTEQAYVDS